MIRWIVIGLFLISPMRLIAQTIVLRSGEHADFSRIVVQLQAASDWEFGRVAGGYELRINAPLVQFDDRQVFNFIPQTRILNIASPAPGRLFLAVTCTCTGDAFELSGGRLVVDIKDGRPNQNSRFETTLSELAEGAVLPSGIRVAALDAVNPIINFFPGPAVDLLPPQADADLIDGLPTITDRPVNEQDPVSARQRLSRNIASPPAATANTGFSVQARMQGQAAASSFASPARPTRPFLPVWPTIAGSALLSPKKPNPNRISAAEKALLEQLARAAAQGLILIENPTFPVPDEPEVMDITPAALVEQPREIPAGATFTQPRRDEHLRIETVIDRDAFNDDARSDLTDAGQICLSGELFEISDWGPANSNSGPLSDFRATLLQEFDEPDPTSILRLVRRYVYLGFGAEALQLAAAFDVTIPGGEVLSQMADIIDDNPMDPAGSLVAQLTCSSAGTMWAALASRALPAGTDLDTKAVLRAFSNLPAHLRQSLGPQLAQKFLNIDDATTAFAIRDATSRSVGSQDPAVRMMEAQLDLRSGDVTAALSNLEVVAGSNGLLGPVALADLVDARLAGGQNVDEDTALLAEAMAAEYRGSDIGRRLIRAAIRGFAASGKIGVAFQRIDLAVADGDISVAQAKSLRTEMHLWNAKKSTDAEFVTIVYRNDFELSADVEGTRAALRAMAGRLTKLGLPEKTRQLYAQNELGMEAIDRQILAAAELAIGDAERANELLSELSGEPAKLLRAQASEMRQDFGRAADIFRVLSRNNDLASAAWRSGDWQSVVLSGSSPRQEIARIISDTSETGAVSDNAAEFSPDGTKELPKTELTEVTPIAEGNMLLTQSRATRQAIEDLLNEP